MADDAEDERVVDALMARATAGAKARPLAREFPARRPFAVGDRVTVCDGTVVQGERGAVVALFEGGDVLVRLDSGLHWCIWHRGDARVEDDPNDV